MGRGGRGRDSLHGNDRGGGRGMGREGLGVTTHKEAGIGRDGEGGGGGGTDDASPVTRSGDGKHNS